MGKNLVKMFIIFFVFLCFFDFSFADFDFENDYTLIDCINGDDSTGVSFDSEKPYQTLKRGIEKTIAYINANINKAGNEENAAGKVFKIKVNCTALNLLDGKISLEFYGNNFNNELIIEGVDDNSLIIKNTYFYLPTDIGNIVFDNANFEIGEKYNYYFYAQTDIKNFYSSGIKIKNSNINLKNGYNLSYNKGEYYSLIYVNGNRHRYKTYYYYSNQQLIYNSNINIKLDNNYIFAMPVLLKDSKINFINSGTGTIFDVNFLPTHSSTYNTETNFSTFISNEIDLGGNNFSTVNNQNFAYINNKFFNFNDFIFGSDLLNINKTIFINNSILNNNIINISKSINLFNNVFNLGFNDFYDIYNHRKNYTMQNIGTEGISWIFKRNHKYNYFDLDFSSSSLYKEITGNTIPISNQEIYIIYQ